MIKKYISSITNSKIFDVIFEDKQGALLEYDTEASYGDPARRIRGWVSTEALKFYEEYKEPVIEVRYADAILFNYADGDWRNNANTTYWTRKKSSSDNLKATWTDGILTSVEIIK